MNGNQNKNHGLTRKLQVRLPPDLAARLDNAAQAYSAPGTPVTPSDLVRIALDRYLPPLPLGEKTP